MEKKSFTDKVCEYVKKIPRGEVRTYGEVAQACGSPKAARAVGTVMAKNFNTDIPCHRVVKSDGSLGNYNRGGLAAKQRLLKSENVTLKGNKVMLKTRNLTA